MEQAKRELARDRRRRRAHDRGQDQGHDGGPTPEPILFLPYDVLKDDGTRPIADLFMACFSEAVQIAVDGIPYTGGDLPRDRATTIRVKVENRGDLDTSALITLWWADPTALFAPASLRADGLSGPVWVDVARRDGSGAPGQAITDPFTLMPPSGMPDHVCLLAEITAGDPWAPGVVDPVNNPHYAQHNIDLVHVGPGKFGASSFFVANPFQSDARVLARLRPVTGEALRRLEQRYLADARELPADAFGLQFVAEGEGDRRQRELAFDLEGGGRRLCQGLVAAGGLEPGQLSAGTVDVTVETRLDEKTETRQGTYGVVVFVEE